MKLSIWCVLGWVSVVGCTPKTEPQGPQAAAQRLENEAPGSEPERCQYWQRWFQAPDPELGFLVSGTSGDAQDNQQAVDQLRLWIGNKKASECQPAGKQEHQEPIPTPQDESSGNPARTKTVTAPQVTVEDYLAFRQQTWGDGFRKCSYSCQEGKPGTNAVQNECRRICGEKQRERFLLIWERAFELCKGKKQLPECLPLSAELDGRFQLRSSDEVEKLPLLTESDAAGGVDDTIMKLIAMGQSSRQLIDSVRERIVSDVEPFLKQLSTDISSKIDWKVAYPSAKEYEACWNRVGVAVGCATAAAWERKTWTEWSYTVNIKNASTYTLSCGGINGGPFVLEPGQSFVDTGVVREKFFIECEADFDPYSLPVSALEHGWAYDQMFFPYWEVLKGASPRVRGYFLVENDGARIVCRPRVDWR